MEVVQGMESLTNPTMIIEVLSDSTERQDKARKWVGYQRLDSPSTYVLVRQDEPLVDVYRRTDDSSIWALRSVSGLDENAALPAIQCQIALAEIYSDVEFHVDDARQS